MKLYGTDKRELLTVNRIDRDCNQLVIRARVFGTMPLTATLTPANVHEGLRLLRWSGIFLLLTMPFRRSAPAPGERT